MWLDSLKMELVRTAACRSVDAPSATLSSQLCEKPSHVVAESMGCFMHFASHQGLMSYGLKPGPNATLIVCARQLLNDKHGKEQSL